MEVSLPEVRKFEYLTFQLRVGSVRVEVMSRQILKIILEFDETDVDELRVLLNRQTEELLAKVWTMTFDMLKKLDAVRYRKVDRIQKLSSHVLEKTQVYEEKTLQKFRRDDDWYISRVLQVHQSFYAAFSSTSSAEDRVKMVKEREKFMFMGFKSLLELKTKHCDVAVKRLEETIKSILKREL